VRRRGWPILALVVAAVMTGALALIGVAYVQQSEKVDDLAAENEQILGDHTAIGQAFAQQSKQFVKQSKEVEAAIRATYRQGFLDGQRARGVPARLSPLARYATLGMLVPRKVPSELSEHAKISAGVDGYAIRWKELALFASSRDPLSVWTRQALGGLVRKAKLGSHRVNRLIGPNGVIYAWRENRSTYALIAVPRLEEAGRSLIASMR
jgi:nitrogen fixation-related uncharacterized protein